VLFLREIGIPVLGFLVNCSVGDKKVFMLL